MFRRNKNKNTKHAIAFIGSLNKFLKYLKKVTPDEHKTELKTCTNQLRGLQIVPGGRHTIISNFYRYVSPHRQNIRHRNEQAFLNLDVLGADVDNIATEDDILKSLKLKELWTTTATPNQKTKIFDFIEGLLIHAEHYHGINDTEFWETSN